MSKTYVETSTELLEGLDEMVREGYYASRTEGINDAIRLLLKQYKLSKLHAKDSSLLAKPAVAGGETRGGVIGQIVAGIDGSCNSLTAFQYALDLARRVKAEVKVVFVVDSRKTDLPIIYTASHFDYGFERVYIPPDPGLKGFYDGYGRTSALSERTACRCARRTRTRPRSP